LAELKLYDYLYVKSIYMILFGMNITVYLGFCFGYKHFFICEIITG